MALPPRTQDYPLYALITPTISESTTPMLMELVHEKAKDGFCGQVQGTVGTSSSCYSYDRPGILAPTAPLDEAIETVVPD